MELAERRGVSLVVVTLVCHERASRVRLCSEVRTKEIEKGKTWWEEYFHPVRLGGSYSHLGLLGWDFSHITLPSTLVALTLKYRNRLHYDLT